MKKYYEAYDERYKTIHKLGCSWASDIPTPIVADTIKKYGIGRTSSILEIGCGEGRDALFLLKQGFSLLASDVSAEAISYCRKKAPEFADSFQIKDCLSSEDNSSYDFIYSVAVIHMLLPDTDRSAFYRYIRDHLNKDGIALICSMGDGEIETETDINDAFVLKERNHPSGTVKVAGTTLRKISFPHFETEITDAGLKIKETGLTGSPPEFNELMYAVVCLE